MNANPPSFVWSDAWLLHSIALATKERCATLRQIIGTGDGINHAIFTWPELKSGLEKLLRAGYIKRIGKEFCVSAFFAQTRPKAFTNLRTVLPQTDDLLEYLNSNSGDAPPQEYLTILEEDYKQAVREYLNERA